MKGREDAKASFLTAFGLARRQLTGEISQTARQPLSDLATYGDSHGRPNIPYLLSLVGGANIHSHPSILPGESAMIHGQRWQTVEQSRPLFIALFSLISLIEGCAPVYQNVQVTSDTAQQFYYVRRDIWDANGLEDPAKQSMPGVLASYGPFEIGSKVPVLDGAQYVFIPVCAAQIAWNKNTRPAFPSQNFVTIKC